MLRRVATALAALPVQAIMTVGTVIDPGAIEPAPNVAMHRYLPHAALLPDCALVVTHAGFGTVMAVLAHGVPLLCLPMGRDQHENAARLMDAGVTLADPSRLDVRGSLACGADVRIDVNCVFEGRVKLAERVEIGAHCVIRDAEIGAGTRIEPFTHIDAAKIGANCRIGPYARVRPGTRLAEEVHIGNFVEVKAAEFSARSKANHLSYIGDATVGCDVNIGAGTITCNYDGADKHRTVIEDDVHIGSDVQLVAPVTVSKGATVGAGTTVWKDTPPGGLVINAKSQEHRPGWKRPQKKRTGETED